MYDASKQKISEFIRNKSNNQALNQDEIEESDPSIYQEIDSSTEKNTDNDSDENGYFLNIRRPIYTQIEQLKVQEYFCGKNHDIRKQQHPFFRQKYTCIEEKGSSFKYVRQTSRFLLQSVDGIKTKRIPLGLIVTPFPELMEKDSKPNLIEVFDNDSIKSLSCKNCGALPYHVEANKVTKNTKSGSLIPIFAKKSSDTLNYNCHVCGAKMSVVNYDQKMEVLFDKINSDMGTIDLALPLEIVQVNEQKF